MASLYALKSVLVLDGEGKRLATKYYTSEFPTVKEQLAFEKVVFAKTQRAQGEIIMLDNVVCLYKNAADVYFYVLGGLDENELVLLSVLNALFDTLSNLLRGIIDKRGILENLDYVMLTIDEMVDGGIILESDPFVLSQRVSMKDLVNETPLAEQTLSQVAGQLKEQFARNFLKGGL